MWKAAFLASCLLLAGIRAVDRPSYGVKLCGREFIRAVIFTCGGSRWRRSISNADTFSSDIDDAVDSWVQPPGPSFFLQHNAEPDSFGMAQNGPEGDGFSRPVRSFISDDVLEALRSSSRMGRDVVLGLSNACCKWGCSKSEISSLC